MQSQHPLTPFESAQMRAITFSINVIGSMAFKETLKALETIKEESLQVHRAYRASEGDIREGHKAELKALIAERRNLLTMLLSHPIETGV
jgi:cellobiose-specific phosphotransferase system component IIA